MHHKAIVLGLFGLLLLGCGDDSSDSGGAAVTPPPPAATPTPTPAAPPAAPGATPAAGAAGMGGAVTPVMCGTEMCTMGVEVAGMMLAPCCDMDSGNICGAGAMNAMTGMVDCEGLNQPGELNAACPDAMSIIGTTLAGCCKPDGMCGVMSNVGYGCVERTDQSATSLMGGTPLEAVACSM